jgi:hypothetical protein
MMLLSRFWYVVLGFLLAGALYVVFLAVGQYNRRNAVAMAEELASDSQVAGWALQIDARRRLDALLLGSVDKGIQESLVNANGKDRIPTSSKDGARKALLTINEKTPADFKEDALFAVDREGRVVAQVGFDAANAFEDFEIGGYPAVFDALHGYLRDDTWILGGKMYRVVARPVEYDVTQPPAGAVVGLRAVDNRFAAELSKRTRTNLAFYAGGQRISSAVSEGFDAQAMDLAGAEVSKLGEDKSYQESGHSEVHALSESMGAMYARLPGDAFDLGGGFAVVRSKVAIAGPMGFLSGADDKDKANVSWGLLVCAFLLATVIGIALSVLEHTLPMQEMVRQAVALKKGAIDFFQLPKFHGSFRAIAQDINAGIERIVEKGGGVARKPADLESILGPVPAQPAMSAFSFPLQDGQQGQPAGAVTSTGGSRPDKSVPGVPPPRPSAPGSRPGSAPGFAPPAPPPSTTAKGGSGVQQPPAPPMMGGGTQLGMGLGGPPPRQSAPGAAPGFPSPGQANNNARPGIVTPLAPPPGPGIGGGMAGVGMAGAGMASAGLGGGRMPPPHIAPMPPGEESEDEEATMVAAIPAEVLAAATGEHRAPVDQSEWLGVYEDFIRTKKQCGEPTDGLTFEKFQHTLKKNRDALMQRHGCKRVRFSVYVKEGRASLKATPVKE